MFNDNTGSDIERAAAFPRGIGISDNCCTRVLCPVTADNAPAYRLQVLFLHRRRHLGVDFRRSAFLEEVCNSGSIVAEKLAVYCRHQARLGICNHAVVLSSMTKCFFRQVVKSGLRL